GLSSFDFMDDIVRRLARKDLFPNLKNIVVSGHSAGGQFVIRYAMLNQVHEQVGTRLTYVTSNASSYAYLDALRPVAHSTPTLSPTAADSAPAFAPFADAKNCTEYNTWPYGLKRRTG